MRRSGNFTKIGQRMPRFRDELEPKSAQSWPASSALGLPPTDAWGIQRVTPGIARRLNLAQFRRSRPEAYLQWFFGCSFAPPAAHSESTFSGFLPPDSTEPLAFYRPRLMLPVLVALRLRSVEPCSLTDLLAMQLLDPRARHWDRLVVECSGVPSPPARRGVRAGERQGVVLPSEGSRGGLGIRCAHGLVARSVRRSTVQMRLFRSNQLLWILNVLYEASPDVRRLECEIRGG